MNQENDILIRISPGESRMVVERQAGGVVTRKEVSPEGVAACFRQSMRTENPGMGTGLLPLNTLAVWQSDTQTKLVLWHPRRYADVALYDTPYPHFPIPRLVFGASFSTEGKLLRTRLGAVADEVPTPETAMYHYPFSNVFENSGQICVGSNVMPTYKHLWKAVNLPAFLLSIPNNMHMYHSLHNRLGLPYRELMEHLRDKDPDYYYTDVLLPNGKTLGDFIQGNEED